MRLREADERQGDPSNAASPRPLAPGQPLPQGAADLWTLLGQVTAASPPPVAPPPGRIEDPSLDDLFARVMARA